MIPMPGERRAGSCSANGTVIPARPGFSHCRRAARARGRRSPPARSAPGARADAHRPALALGPLIAPRGHRQAEQDRERDQHERDDSRRAADQPPEVLRAADVWVIGEQRVLRPLIDLPRDTSRSPRPRRVVDDHPSVLGEHGSRAPSGPRSSAIFDSVSASSAVCAERGRADQRRSTPASRCSGPAGGGRSCRRPGARCAR